MRILAVFLLACLASGAAQGEPAGTASPFDTEWRLGAAINGSGVDDEAPTTFGFTPRSVGVLSIDRIEFSLDADKTSSLTDDVHSAARPGEKDRFTVGGAVAIQGIEFAGAASRLEESGSVGEAYSARVSAGSVGARLGYSEWETGQGRNLERFSLGAEFLTGDALSVDAGLALTQEEDRATDATGAIRLRLAF
jgi:hypothetical protein